MAFLSFLLLQIVREHDYCDVQKLIKLIKPINIYEIAQRHTDKILSVKGFLYRKGMHPALQMSTYFETIVTKMNYSGL